MSNNVKTFRFGESALSDSYRIAKRKDYVLINTFGRNQRSFTFDFDLKYNSNLFNFLLNDLTPYQHNKVLDFLKG